MFKSTFISIGLHVFFIIFAYYGLPSFKVKEPIESPIDIVEDTPISSKTSLKLGETKVKEVKEIKKVTNFLKMSDSPEYRDDITDKNAGINKSDNPSMAGMSEDELYKDAYECILQHQKASASLLQRRLKVGYARAARLLDILEENGVVGPVNGAKPREIYIKE